MINKILCPKDLNRFIIKGYNPFELFYDWLVGQNLSSLDKVLFYQPQHEPLAYLKILINELGKTVYFSNCFVSEKFLNDLEQAYINKNKKHMRIKDCKTTFAYMNLNIGPATFTDDDNLDENYIYIFPGFIKDFTNE